MNNVQLNKKGALSSNELQKLIDAGFISVPLISDVKPSSIDLVLGDDIYEVDGVFQNNSSKTVLETLKCMNAKKISFEQPLLCNHTYVVPVITQMNLPSFVYGYANPKSSTGRLDMHVRLLADRVSWYDKIPQGFSATSWVMITPKTFSCVIRPGMSLNQIRLFSKDTRINTERLEILMQKPGLLFEETIKDGVLKKKIQYKDMDLKDGKSLMLHVDCESSKIIGYKSKNTNQVIDFGKINYYEYQDFFEVLEKKPGEPILLEKDAFYILSTLEHVSVPNFLACEMSSIDDRLGDFRAHYAGFIDPGWGWGKFGEENGRQLTLEVRPFENMFILHRQPIARVKFELLTSIPSEVYDSIGSNYTVQSGPTLSKHFKKIA
ncbi:2'-deoxycytidine 5'-triphosphate deaminase [Candidatus Nomurabacteria bacterium]|nr:2'-deoxycytidine 5'-triphosphate deaminase [Candidatus Nomurabacteria bacterium]